MKATLHFDLSEDREEFRDCMQASKMSAALHDIQNNIFRPARKHLYNDKELNDLIAKNPDAIEIIGLLETKYVEILNNYEIDI